MKTKENGKKIYSEDLNPFENIKSIAEMTASYQYTDDPETILLSINISNLDENIKLTKLNVYEGYKVANCDFRRSGQTLFKVSKGIQESSNFQEVYDKAKKRAMKMREHIDPEFIPDEDGENYFKEGLSIGIEFAGEGFTGLQFIRMNRAGVESSSFHQSVLDCNPEFIGRGKKDVDIYWEFF